MSNNQITPNQNQNNLPSASAPQVEEIGFALIEEIDRLEDLILNNTRIPLINKTLVDEDVLLRQLDELRINIPDCYTQALEILKQRDKIIADAQSYAQKSVENAHRKASQLLDESRIVQQAENQAAQIRQQVQKDCENLQRKTMAEVEQIRQKIQYEAKQMKQQAIMESEEIHHEADMYTDSVLAKLEKDLADMLRIISNGRKQVHQSKMAPVNRHQDMTIKKQKQAS